MLTERASGVLLHPTSLPGRFGIGDLGREAELFLDWLAGAGQSYWQVLPLCPTAHGDSPYQSPSAFAGNPLLISPDRLAEQGLLTFSELRELADLAPTDPTYINFPRLTENKLALLEIAGDRFRRLPATSPLQREFADFREAEREWLEPHAMFLALRDVNRGQHWLYWDTYVDAQKRPTADAAVTLAPRIAQHEFLQFIFAQQWQRLRALGRERGIRIIGDIPIYVSHDSADVWANRHLFQLDETGRSTFVAGVPPDYFSATGQLWSNPLYDWDANDRTGYAWWIRRMRAALDLVDLVRLDHFRGFEAYWAVPASESTAIHGEWIPGPGPKLFDAIRLALAPGGDISALPIIAEDLGLITEPVHQLREQFQLPGMKVLQFILPGEPHEQIRGEEFPENSVVYTGTHDNDTSLGWFRSDILAQPERLDRLRRYLPCHEVNVAWELIEFAWHAGSRLAVAPLQDVLSLGSESRMNTPGTFGENCRNWQWRVEAHAFTTDTQQRLRAVTAAARRESQGPLPPLTPQTPEFPRVALTPA